MYYYWRQIAINNPDSDAGKSRGPQFASQVSLLDFVTSEHNFVREEIENRQCWQLAYGHHLDQRKEKSKEWNDDELLSNAITNVEKIDLIGLQEDFGHFLTAYEKKYGIQLKLKNANITKKRRGYFDIPVRVRKIIYEKCFLDMELYYYILRKTKS